MAAAIILFSMGMQQPVSSLLIAEDGSLVAYRTAELGAVNRKRPSQFIFGKWTRARQLPDPLIPEMLDSRPQNNMPVSAKERLPEAALAEARKLMRGATSGVFSCQAKAWCTLMSPEGVLVVVVDDGRYAGAACDVAGLVIAPRARFDECRSGVPMLNGLSLRKTGLIEIDFSGSARSQDWQVTTAMVDKVQPWNTHRQYDWRRNIYDLHLPAWIAAQRSYGRPDNMPVAEDEEGRDNSSVSPTDVGDHYGVSDSGE